MDREQKQHAVGELKEAFDQAAIVVATQYKGLTVVQMEQLRNQMKDAGAMFKVTKNRLAKRAVENSKIKGLKTFLEGPVALAWSEDPVTAPKILKDYSDENDNLILIGGILDGKVLSKEEIKKIAELPSLDSLRAGILGLLTAPAAKIANIVTQPAAQCVRVISAYANKEEEKK